MTPPTERPHVTLVVSFRPDGTPCPGCGVILRYLRDERFVERFDAIVAAHEGDDFSPGAILAARHDVERYPFVTITDADGTTTVYTSVLHALDTLGWRRP